MHVETNAFTFLGLSGLVCLFLYVQQVLVGAGASILGNVNIGDGAKIGACSLVLIDVPPYTTAVGVPAQILGKGAKASRTVGKELPALSMDHTSSIIDYII